MKRHIFGLGLAVLLVAGNQVNAVIIEELNDAGETVAVTTSTPTTPVMALPVDPAQFKQFAIQAVNNINSFLVLPTEVKDVLVTLAQNSDLIVQSIKMSWDKGLPIVTRLAVDLGPQIRQVFQLLQPLAQGNFDDVSKVGDQLWIKAGDILQILFNYQPQVVEFLMNLKDSVEARHLKLLIAVFAAERGYGATFTVKNIDYALGQILAALQNEKVLKSLQNGITQLKTPGFWDRMSLKFAPEVKALRQLGEQALVSARAIIIDRTGKTPEEWVEVVKQGGNEAVATVEKATGKSVEELKAIAKAKVGEYAKLAQQNADKIKDQVVAAIAA